MLESVNGQEEEIPKIHFDSIVDDNSATHSDIQILNKLPEGYGNSQLLNNKNVFVCECSISASKFNLKNEQQVKLMLAIIRLEEQNTDMLLSYYHPSNSTTINWDTTIYEFYKTLESITIKDWDLFN